MSASPNDFEKPTVAWATDNANCHNDMDSDHEDSFSDYEILNAVDDSSKKPDAHEGEFHRSHLPSGVTSHSHGGAGLTSPGRLVSTHNGGGYVATPSKHLDEAVKLAAKLEKAQTKAIVADHGPVITETKPSVANPAKVIAEDMTEAEKAFQKRLSLLQLAALEKMKPDREHGKAKTKAVVADHGDTTSKAKPDVANAARIDAESMLEKEAFLKRLHIRQLAELAKVKAAHENGTANHKGNNVVQIPKHANTSEKFSSQHTKSAVLTHADVFGTTNTQNNGHADGKSGKRYETTNENGTLKFWAPLPDHNGASSPLAVTNNNCSCANQLPVPAYGTAFYQPTIVSSDRPHHQEQSAVDAEVSKWYMNHDSESQWVYGAAPHLLDPVWPEVKPIDLPRYYRRVEGHPANVDVPISSGNDAIRPAMDTPVLMLPGGAASLGAGGATQVSDAKTVHQQGANALNRPMLNGLQRAKDEVARLEETLPEKKQGCLYLKGDSEFIDSVFGSKDAMNDKIAELSSIVASLQGLKENGPPNEAAVGPSKAEHEELKQKLSDAQVLIEVLKKEKTSLQFKAVGYKADKKILMRQVAELNVKLAISEQKTASALQAKKDLREDYYCLMGEALRDEDDDDEDEDYEDGDDDGDDSDEDEEDDGDDSDDDGEDDENDSIEDGEEDEGDN